MDKGTILLKDYIRKTARVLVLSSKLDPKKKSKAQTGFTKSLPSNHRQNKELRRFIECN